MGAEVLGIAPVNPAAASPAARWVEPINEPIEAISKRRAQSRPPKREDSSKNWKEGKKNLAGATERSLFEAGR